MTRMRSILLGAGTSLVLLLTACCPCAPPLVASNSSAGGSSGSTPPAVASTPSGGGSSVSSTPPVASHSPAGGSSVSSTPPVAGKSPGGGSSGSISPVASKSPGSGSGGPGLVAVTSGKAAAGVQETNDLTFAPVSVTVKVGDIVGFTNGSDVIHNVTFTASGIASPTMNTGDSFLVKFTRNGTYNYVCTFHPHMVGTVTVG